MHISSVTDNCGVGQECYRGNSVFLREKGPLKNTFQRILKLSKVTVYAEKYAICTFLENMRIMLQMHIHIKTNMPIYMKLNKL